ncbi:MAG: hypothetical protein QXG09_08065 [Candidatus Bathyarchaeia archaeon]
MIFSATSLVLAFMNNFFGHEEVEMEPKLLDVTTAQTFTLEKLLKDIGNKSVVIIFLDPKDLEEEKECQELSLTVRNLYIQYGKIIEFLTVMQVGDNVSAENFSSVIPNCWINGYPLWRHLIDLENKTIRTYNITKTPAIITLDDKHQFVEKIEGFINEQRLEVALVRIICSCAPSIS